MSAVPHPHQPIVLLTGFAPFAGESVNPSWEAVRALQAAPLDAQALQRIGFAMDDLLGEKGPE